MKGWVSMEANNDTIEVAISGFGILKSLITDKSIKVKKGSLLSDLLNVMIERYGMRFRKVVIDPETKEISTSICILINGKTANNLEEKLKDRDEITLFIFVGGG
ncbi:MoaD/ThiS family protein [Candidatus Pacearchaeota archaeon]|nr:MoaD/ThiS family protein [Candidatus Pacearchaeota archaeon]